MMKLVQYKSVSCFMPYALFLSCVFIMNIWFNFKNLFQLIKNISHFSINSMNCFQLVNNYELTIPIFKNRTGNIMQIEIEQNFRNCYWNTVIDVFS